MVSSLIILALASAATALSVSSPSESTVWTVGEDQTVTWNAVSTDKDTFSIYLSNQVEYPPTSVLLVSDVSKSDGSATIDGSKLTAGDSFTINFTNGDETEEIYAQSNQFNITEASTTSSSSSASASSTSSSSSGTATSATTLATVTSSSSSSSASAVTTGGATTSAGANTSRNGTATGSSTATTTGTSSTASSTATGTGSASASASGTSTSSSSTSSSTSTSGAGKIVAGWVVMAVAAAMAL